jgi:hypothetical protein
MRNLLAFLAAVTLTFFGLGWYLGWYRLHTSPADPGHRNVTIDINTVKIGEDLERGEQKLHEIIERAGKDGAPKEKDTKAGEKGAKAPEVDPITPAKGELDHPGAIKPAKPSPEKKEGDLPFWLPVPH